MSLVEPPSALTPGADTISTHLRRTTTEPARPDERAMNPTTSAASPVRYRVLGPLEVIGADGEPLELRGNKVRALLCALLVSPGHTVSLDRIISFLWGDEPPAAATATLQAYVSQLRKLLEPDRGPRRPPSTLVTRSPGYALLVEAGALDTDELDRYVTQGEDAMAEGRYAAADDLFSAAIALRRGTPFADVADEPFAVGPIARFEQLLVLATERRVDALLALGRVGAAAAELEQLVTEHPLRERFWAQLVEALYRGDRQADALRAYQTCRTVLTEELGVEPGPALQDMERAILAQEPLPTLATPASATEPNAASGPTSAPVGLVPSLPDPQIPDAAPAPLRSLTGPAARSALVGRVGELDQIDQAMRAADEGSGSIVVLEGESGIGKSRLAEEAVHRAEAAGWRTAWSTCMDEVGSPALWPWQDTTASLGLAVPAVVPDDDPDADRFQRVLAVLSTLLTASRERPLLVVIDDLQWADAASLQALAVLASRLHGARLVVVVTVRRPDVHEHAVVDDLLADLSRQRHVHRLRLGGLDAVEVARLVDDLSGEPVHLALVDAVNARTGGNPFFVSELVRLLTSEQAMATAPSDALIDSVPDSVREVVERRLGRLPDDTCTLLRLSAIAGPSIELDVLEHATGLGAERVITLMEAAVMSGMLRELDDRIGWRFTHALVRDAVRATLGRAQRARLHGTLADAIQAVYAHDLPSHLEEMAQHSVEAAVLGRADAAIRWSTDAALAARATGRFDRAARLWQGALGVLQAGPADPVQRFDLMMQLARDQRASGDTLGFGESLSAAIELATELRDRHRMALAAAELGWVNLWNTRPYGSIDPASCDEIERLAHDEPDPALAARLFGAVAVELYYGDTRERGEQLALRAVDLARDTGDAVLLGRTLNNYVLAAWVPERAEQRLVACNESLALVGQGLPAQTEAVARLHRASLLLRRRDLAGVEADLSRCRALVTELSQPEITAQLMYAECGLGLLRAQWSYAERLADEAFDMHSRTQVWGADWCRLIQRVCLRDAQGRLDEVLEDAIRLAEQPSLAPARATTVLGVARSGDLVEARRLAERWDWRDEPNDWSWDHRIADWAEAAALTGSPDAATFYELLSPHEDELRVSGTAVVCRGSMHGVLARLAAATGDLDAARRHRDESIRVNRSVDAAWWAERDTAELAQL